MWRHAAVPPKQSGTPSRLNNKTKDQPREFQISRHRLRPSWKQCWPCPSIPSRRLMERYIIVSLVSIMLFQVILVEYFATASSSKDQFALDVTDPAYLGGRNTKEKKTIHRNVVQNSTIVYSPLSTLSDRDREYFTVRINTWKRNPQLTASVDHYTSCPGAVRVQVIWCDSVPPPIEIVNHTSGKVVIERHPINNLNERFRILDPTPTLGILNVDDDVLRPCEALDAGFFKWVKAPDRMIGFDSRLHVETENGTWEYGYSSTTKKANRYSLSLTRFCFLHRDYLIQYTESLSRTIYDKVIELFNCEDIAMSMMVSARTGGQPPLLADCWAMNTMLKMETETKISGTANHKKSRDGCVESFASILGLKGGTKPLQKAPIVGGRNYQQIECGARLPNEAMSDASMYKSERQIALEATVHRWVKGKRENMQKELSRMVMKAGINAYKKGLIKLKK